MCIEIFRNPGKAFGEAAKRRKMSRTALVLLESALMTAVAMAIITSRVALAPWVFALVIAIGIIGGYVIKIVSTTLGARGGFFEGMTAISYAFAPLSAALLLIAVLALLPVFGVLIGIVASVILFAFGLSVLYRGVKEMFRTDMITALVAVSILALAFVIALQFSFSLNLLLSAGRLIPAV